MCALSDITSFFEGIPYREDIGFPNHNFTADPYFNFTIQPGAERCFEITIIDDSIVESRYEYLTYHIGLYTPAPSQRLTGSIRIQDDEGTLKKLIPHYPACIALSPGSFCMKIKRAQCVLLVLGCVLTSKQTVFAL